MVKHGFYDFLNWFDDRAWYPLGRIVGGTVYPGLMITSGSIHHILSTLNIPTHIRDICVFLAPLFSGLTAVATYFLTKELWSQGAGLFAAGFIAIVPGYISRSLAGSYDNEGIAIFALMFTYYLWIKSVKTGSIYWAAWTALSYFYMVSLKIKSFCLLLKIYITTTRGYHNVLLYWLQNSWRSANKKIRLLSTLSVLPDESIANALTMLAVKSTASLHCLFTLITLEIYWLRWNRQPLKPTLFLF